MPTADLGQVLMHEHIFTLTADVQQNYPEEWGSEEVLPYLREHGVTDEQIETMLVANPRRYFE